MKFQIELELKTISRARTLHDRTYTVSKLIKQNHLSLLHTFFFFAVSVLKWFSSGFQDNTCAKVCESVTITVERCFFSCKKQKCYYKFEQVQNAVQVLVRPNILDDETNEIYVFK